jgi:hypothetical protein
MGYRRFASNRDPLFHREILLFVGEIPNLRARTFLFANGGRRKSVRSSPGFSTQALGYSVQLVQIAKGNDHLACLSRIDLDAY